MEMIFSPGNDFTVVFIFTKNGTAVLFEENTLVKNRSL